MFLSIFIQDKRRSADLDRIWLETLLCLIGEAFDDASEDVSTKKLLFFTQTFRFVVPGFKFDRKATKWPFGPVMLRTWTV